MITSITDNYNTIVLLVFAFFIVTSAFCCLVHREILKMSKIEHSGSLLDGVEHKEFPI